MKKIIILARKMDCGGTEVSLLNTLNELNKMNVEITLGLYKKEGELLSKVPSNIRIIEFLSSKENNYFEKIKKVNLDIIYNKFLGRYFKKFFYKKILKNTNQLDESYDLAIDFHGYGYYGTPYLIEKINASHKVTFVHDENIFWTKYVEDWLDKFDKIYCVSNACKKNFMGKYKYLADKTDIFRNIIDTEKIDNMLDEYNPRMSNKFNILTIGRMEYQKGYDILLDICKGLDSQKYTWYIIGDGNLRSKIKKEVIRNNLQENVIILGMQKNPYPYLKKCDLYVQPSRHEGYGIAIAEARYLNKAIIATKLDCISEQIENNKTGILCDLDAKDFQKNIIELMNNKEKKQFLIDCLKKIQFKDNNDINKFMEILE